MNKKALMIITGSIICGVIAVLLVNFYIRSQEKKLYKGMNMVPVLVMAQDVSANTVLEMGMVAKRDMPEKYVHGNVIHPKDVKLITGQILNFPLKRGDTLLWTDLGQEEEIKKLRHKGLAGTITLGERALTVPVDQVSGVAGHLKPGDHIDILCTVRNQETGEEATLTLLQNITILAVGSTLAGEGGFRDSYSTITVLVTLEEAELVVFAREKGKLASVLRNPEDIETHKEIPKMDFTDIMKAEFRRNIQEKRDRIQVIKRGKVDTK